MEPSITSTSIILDRFFDAQVVASCYGSIDFASVRRVKSMVALHSSDIQPRPSPHTNTSRDRIRSFFEAVQVFLLFYPVLRMKKKLQLVGQSPQGSPQVVVMTHHLELDDLEEEVVSDPSFCCKERNYVYYDR